MGRKLRRLCGCEWTSNCCKGVALEGVRMVIGGEDAKSLRSIHGPDPAWQQPPAAWLGMAWRGSSRAAWLTRCPYASFSFSGRGGRARQGSCRECASWRTGTIRVIHALPYYGTSGASGSPGSPAYSRPQTRQHRGLAQPVWVQRRCLPPLVLSLLLALHAGLC